MHRHDPVPQQIGPVTLHQIVQAFAHQRAVANHRNLPLHPGQFPTLTDLFLAGQVATEFLGEVLPPPDFGQVDRLKAKRVQHTQKYNPRLSQARRCTFAR